MRKKLVSLFLRTLVWVSSVAFTVFTALGAEEQRSFNANEIFDALSVDSGFDGRRINLDIQFQLNSAVLSPETKQQLKELAEALKHADIAQDIFEIAGHTDASGDNASNLRLSIARANSVVDYLINTHQLDPAKIVATGYGERFPRAGKGANDPLNRRVEIINHGRWKSTQEIQQDAEIKGETEKKDSINFDDIF